jgi:hypothetical protein
MNSFTFLFKAVKETHEQCKTKIDIDEFRSGTTNITLSYFETMCLRQKFNFRDGQK